MNENNEDDHRHAVHIRVSMMRMAIHRANECFGPGTVDKGTPRSGVKDQGVRDYHSLRGTAHVAPAVMSGRFIFSGAGVCSLGNSSQFSGVGAKRHDQKVYRSL